MLRLALPQGIFVPAIYLLVAAVAYWQVFFGVYPLQWDAIDCFLAWRYAVTELIRDGQWPLWNANAYLGFPLFADPECGAWYPVLWLFSLFGAYDLRSLAMEWCLHTVIAGTGMHLLMRQLGCSRGACLIAGISFMCSGMFVSNAQNFIYLIGIAWFPWVLAGIRRMLTTGSLRHALMAAVPVFMLCAGSYPGITIIAAYATGVYLMLALWQRRAILRDRTGRITLFRALGVFGAASLALCAVVLVPVAYALPWITRTQGLLPEKILENPLSLKAMVSFLFPFAVGTPDVEWGSDFSMLNAYCGMFALLFALWALRYADRRYITVFCCALVLLLLAVGSALPFRMWVAHLPGLGLFRHPSIFRFFVIFCLCVLAALAWDKLYVRRKALRNALLALTGLMVLVVVWVWPSGMVSGILEAIQAWQQPGRAVSLTVPARIALQAGFLLLLLLGALWLWHRHWLRWMPALVAIDLILAVQLNAPATIFAPLDAGEQNEKLHTAMHSTSPYDGRPLIQLGGDSLRAGVDLVWRNEGIFLHQPQWDGYNSFVHRGYDALERSGQLAGLIRRPLLFSTADTTARMVVKLSPGGHIEATAEVVAAGPMVLMQNFMPGWKAQVNGRPVPVSVFGGAFVQVPLEAGKNQVLIRYAPQWPGALALLSGALLIVILLYAGFTMRTGAETLR